MNRGSRPNGARTDRVQELDRIEDLRATKEMILREAEYVLSLLREERAFWDDIEKEIIVCPRCGELLDPQAVCLSLASLDGYMLPDEAKRVLARRGLSTLLSRFLRTHTILIIVAWQ